MMMFLQESHLQDSVPLLIFFLFFFVDNRLLTEVKIFTVEYSDEKLVSLLEVVKKA